MIHVMLDRWIISLFGIEQNRMAYMNTKLDGYVYGIDALADEEITV